MQVDQITVPFVLNISVNCYLLRVDDGFVLIDTGKAGKRKHIQQEMHQLGCRPRNLRLIILTHGDFDHSGNAAYLRDVFHSEIAMHDADRGMVERGDMFWNRKQPNKFVRWLMGLFFRLDKDNRFTPDICLKEGDNLSAFGLDAEVIELPGHSAGSIGILTAEGDLFCGDLLANTSKPDLWSIIDDPDAVRASVDKLKHYDISTVYPGHGKPFSMDEFRASGRKPAQQ